jgi:hypothetical protein
MTRRAEPQLALLARILQTLDGSTADNALGRAEQAHGHIFVPAGCRGNRPTAGP